MSLRQRSKLPASQGSYNPTQQVVAPHIHSHLAETQFPLEFDPVLGPDVTAEWIEDTNWGEEQNRLQGLSEAAAAEQEELDYQAAVAKSLELPAVTPAEPGMYLTV